MSTRHIAYMSGYTYDELMNMTIADIEMIEQPEEIASHIKKIKEVGHDHFETRHRRKDGVILMLRSVLTICQLAMDELAYSVVTSPSVRSQKDAILRSKLLLQNVIDSTPDWMSVKDFQHKFLLVNKSFAEALNITPQNMIGKADTEFFSEELCLGNPDKGISGYHTRR